VSLYQRAISVKLRTNTKTQLQTAQKFITNNYYQHVNYFSITKHTK